MTISNTARRRLLAAIPAEQTVSADEADFIKQAQAALGVKADGIAGQKTLSAAWLMSPPQAAEVVARAQAALSWPRLTYSMTRNTGLGERWLPDPDDAPATGDCSDFVAHCLAMPKDQTQGLSLPLVRRQVWLGADALGTDAIGSPWSLTEAQPGDIVVYQGRWERGERVSIGHVEICVDVDVDAGKIWTVGCASGNRPGAIARADKTALWRRKGASVIRPRWYS